MKSNKIIAVIAAVSCLATLSGCRCSGHKHDFSIIKYDEHSHWYECECGKKTKPVDHDLKYAGNNDCHWQVCECGYEGEKENHQLGHGHDENYHYDYCVYCLHKFNIEDHEFEQYGYDEENHWKVCECGENDITKTPHSFTEKVVDAKYLKEAADDSHPNVYYYSCICGAKGNETFTSGLPANHVHTYDYKGYCTNEYCDSCIQKELDYYGIGGFTVGEIVFKTYIPIVGSVSLIADFASLENSPVIIYKENGDKLLEYYTSKPFINDKAQTLYVHVEPKHNYGYIAFACNHQIDHTGSCTQCDEYDTANHLTLDVEKTVELIDNTNIYFAFTAPYSGLFEINSKSKANGNPAKILNVKNSDGTAADYEFGRLVATKDETYYFTALPNSSDSREKYVFSIAEVRNEVTAVVNSVSVTSSTADLSINIIDGSIARGQIINIITNNGAATSYVVDDVKTESYIADDNTVTVDTVNNHIYIKNSSFSATDKNMLITSQDKDEYIDTLYFNYRMFSVEEIGDDISIMNGARLILDLFGNQTFTPIGAVTIFSCPTVSETLLPSEGSGIEIKFAFAIPNNLFKKATTYDVYLRFNGTYHIGECALVDSKAIAESIRYHDEVKYYTDMITKGYLDIYDRYWAADLGKGEKYYSTLTLTDAGKAYESDYKHFDLFLVIESMEDTPNGLKVTYSIFFSNLEKKEIDIKELSDLWFIEEDGTKHTFYIYSSGDNYFIFENLTTSEPVLAHIVGIAF